MSIERGADREFEGPKDSQGQPSVGNEALDIEVKFTEDGPVQYRWFLDSPKGVFIGAWRESREQAYREGQNFLSTGRAHG